MASSRPRRSASGDRRSAGPDHTRRVAAASGRLAGFLAEMLARGGKQAHGWLSVRFNRGRASGCPKAGGRGLAGVARMSSAYRLHPASYYSSPSRLHHKVGAALAFILFGSIVGASGFMLQTDGPEPFSSGRPAMTAASPKPGTAHAPSPAAPPAPAVSTPTSPPVAPAQSAPAATMIAAAPEPAPMASPEPGPMAAPEPAPAAVIASADAESAVAAATEPLLPPTAAAKKAKKKV